MDYGILEKNMTEIQTDKIFYKILLAFEKIDLNYRLLRTRDEAIFQDYELDVLVWPSEKGKLYQVLRNLGFKKWKRNPLFKKEVYCFFDKNSLYFLDIHFSMIQNGIKYLNLNELSKEAKRDLNGFKILTNEEEVVHLFFHNLVGKGYLQKKHLKKVRELLIDGINTKKINNMINDEKIYHYVSKLLQNPEYFNNPKSIELKKIIQTIKKRLILKYPSNSGRMLIKKIYFKFFYKNPGIHVTFLGVDGAGKSTTIKYLEKELNGVKGVKYKTVYMGPWGQSQSKWHKWILKNKITLPYELDRKIKLGKIKFYLKGLIYYLSVYFELWYRYFKMIRPNISMGRIVISDRYIYDLRYLYKKRFVIQFKIMRKLITFLFPVPDHIFFVYNYSESIVKRKPQLEVHQITKYQKYYEKVLTSKAHTKILTDKSPEIIAKDLKLFILQMLLYKRSKNFR